jgi:hypothetical protein
MSVRQIVILLATVLPMTTGIVFGQEAYRGPVPEKADLPYIRHANKLVATDPGQANEQTVKGDTVVTVAGANATAKTPLTEPAFILKQAKLDASQMQLYKMEAKGGQRELRLAQRPGKKDARPVRMSLDPLGNGLYKLEVQEPLANGEYCLSPSGSSAVFCFAVY